MFETIRIETDSRGVARLWLARSQKHNALSQQMMEELIQAAADLGTDPAVRVVVLCAEGSTFCAGGDLAWMKAQMQVDAQTRRAAARCLATMLQALNLMPKPLIARVHGNAFGGGVGMMSVCDIAIAAQGTRFGLTEVKLGLIPATIGPYVLARMGEDKARRVFFSGRLFDADEAERLNLAARVVPAEELDQAVDEEIAPFLLGAPRAIAAAKAQCRSLGPRIDEAVIEDSIDRLVATWEDGEASEGIAAFFDKRRPGWQI
ncbi:crotonase/enoyl-CoA hydratase family protein [Paracoccus seriniphilus]|uniref:Methylglutaconyl-CoA hydratase n=1 Tax=Paracoccus seriniphilus TaxID=184748 RepID=A0A239PW16_9RHOB|nr:crotonase/enoyl-CoA hydratase family protein [Paracoccus seriniphilus]WCR13185.1 crotonase/enoyl-CoA hydratase family protein [Paracoccus seriniphilus]SNT74494.1 methylglutaconyl-CoA hydratase [Paracoccus seriniphilus]